MLISHRTEHRGDRDKVLTETAAGVAASRRSWFRMTSRRALMTGVALAVLVPLTAHAGPSPQASVDAASGASGAGRVDKGAYTTLEGTFNYLAYLPVGWKKSERLPLYVMLHGCGTTPEQQMNANAMNPIADRERVILLYPDVWETGKAIGGFGQCWRGSSGAFPNSWIRGGGGDADVIAAMTNAVRSRYGADRERVYLIGMSAGAFQTADTAIAYSDVFAAAGITGGGLYAVGVGCAGLTSDVVAPVAQLAAAAMGPRARPIPYFSIGGTADAGGEAPSPGGCSRLGFEQAMATNNIVVSGSPDGGAYTQDDRSTRKGKVPGGRSWTRYVWRDRDGCQIGERWVVDGMGHFWPGGSADPRWAEWTDPKAPNAAAASLRFFKQFTLSGGDTSCPTRGRTERTSERRV